jgi:hypothetical protein
VPFISRSEYALLASRPLVATEVAACGIRPSMRFCDPSTYEAWSSDLHQGYQPWLCCTFRVSHPLGALFRSVPFQPCFMLVTPLGFDGLQRFSLAGSVPASQQGIPSLPLLGVLVRRPPRRPTSRICAPGEPVSLDQCYLVARARSAPDVIPFEVSTSSALAPHMTAGPPFMGFVTMLDGRNRPSPSLLCNVSKNRRVGPPLSR